MFKPDRTAVVKKIIGIMPLLLIVALFVLSTGFASGIMPKRSDRNIISNNKISGGEYINNTGEVQAKHRHFELSELLMNQSEEVPVLLYHHIAEEVTSDTIVSPEIFENQIKTLTDSGYTGIFFDQLAAYVEGEGELPEKPIIITFDDGYLSSYELAFPILKKYDMKATIFVIGISVGKETYRNSGDNDFKILPRFNYEQANEMIASGIVSIQSHSYDMHHWEPFEILLNGRYRDGILPFEDESIDEYRNNFTADCMLAKTQLEAETGMKLTAYAYPQGRYTEENDRILREIGIKATVTSHYGSNYVVKYMPETIYNLRRMMIDNIPGEQVLEILREFSVMGAWDMRD